MEQIWELLEALLSAFGLACAAWLIFGRMLLPAGMEDTAVQTLVRARGSGNGLEHTMAGLRWLRRSGLWRGEIIIRDCGLDGQGRAAAMALAMEPGVELDRSGPAQTERTTGKDAQ